MTSSELNRTVLLTQYDLLSILAGRELQVPTSNGVPVQARMYTPEEFLNAHLEARAKDPYPGDTPAMTLSQAEDMVRPHNLFELL